MSHPRFVGACRRPVLLAVCAAAALAFMLVPATGHGEREGQARAAQVDPSLLEDFEWRNIGPINGGRSIAVGGSVARPSEYYFGATGGGLWKTTDGGTEWDPVTDGQINASSVGAIEVCPANPDIVYIGMGEVQLRGDIIQGDGVYRTTDGGETWTHLGLADTQAIGRIRVDPVNCDRVFVAALGHPYGPNDERGVFRSNDGGQTWERVLFRNNQTGAVDIAMDPDNPNVLYAGFWHAYRTEYTLNSGGPGGGLFKSTDGGDSWTNLTENPGMPGGPIGKVGISVSGADSNRLYAIIEANEGGVFRSDDAGATWQLVNSNRNLRQRAFYYTRIYADPVERDRVYVLNVNFFRSNDGGATFQSISTPHGDNHDLWIAPDNNQRMVEGNDGGANVSINGGQSWTEQDYSTAQMYHVTTTNDTPYLVCGSQQDANTACMSSEGDGDEFFSVGGGESGYIAVDPRDSNVFYAGSYGGQFTRFDRRTEQERAIDIWPDNPMGHPARDLKERFQWTFPIMTNPARPRAVYASSQHVFVTTNEGQSWRQISPDLTRADPATLGDSGGPITKDQTSIEYYATVFAVAPSTVDRNVIWAGSDDGLVHVTRNHGGSWQRVRPPLLPTFSRITTIDASPHEAGAAYLAANRYRSDDRAPYLYKTTDYGQSWTRISRGIADGDFLWAIREDPVRRGLLYAGTEHGVYVSFDDGAHWQSLSNNLPDVSVQDLVVKGDDLVIATHGRGFYVLDDINILRQLTPGVMASAAHLFAPSATELGIDEGVTVDYLLGDRASSAALEFVGKGGRSLGRQRVARGEGVHRVVWDSPAGVSGRVGVSLVVDGRAVQSRTARLERVRRTVRVRGRQEAAPANLAEAQRVSPDAIDARALPRRARTHVAGPKARVSQAPDGPVDLLDPADPIRGEDSLGVFYQVREPVDSITVTVLNRAGEVVRTFTGLNATVGLRSFNWNLRYPNAVSFPGLIFWAANTSGPLSPWGQYRLVLTAGGDSDEQEFEIRRDPRLPPDITQADIDEQFALARRIVDRTSEANQAVIDIRACKSQVDARLAETSDPEVRRGGMALNGVLSTVEEAIYQVRLQSSQDPLNFPIRLNNKIAALRGIVESADDRPTDQTYEVFDLLSGQLEEQLVELQGIVSRDVADFNAALQEAGLQPIACTA
jgi:photosystem II stability/assembly factor-like uncharacterized protein